MEINEKQIFLWSKLGSRATYGLTILELAKKIENNLLVVTADTSTSAGLERFKKKYPENYFDVGIAEQNSIGIAAGLASENFTVFASTFTPFQTMRCLEQIKVNLCYMNIPVNLVGLASGVVLGDLGYTHCSIEDISVMRSFPNMTVLSPADCGETAKAVFAAAKYNKPVYIRLTGGTNKSTVSLIECYYLIEGTGTLTISTTSESTDLSLTGKGKYGLRPGQLKFGNDKQFKLTTDESVDSYLLVTEFRRN